MASAPPNIAHVGTGVGDSSLGNGAATPGAEVVDALLETSGRLSQDLADLAAAVEGLRSEAAEAGEAVAILRRLQEELRADRDRLRSRVAELTRELEAERERARSTATRIP
jgi:chromosome segregation ATPase